MSDLSISNINETAIIAEDGTIVVMIYGMIGEKYFEATGTAKLDPGDTFDEQIGLELAYGRALRTLGRRVLSEGNRGVHLKDKARQAQQEASKAALKAKRKASKKARKEAKKPTGKNKGSAKTNK